MIVRARPSGGQNQMRGMGGGGQDGRLSVEILGHDLDTSKRLAQDVKAILDSTPGVADSRLQRDDGRPELSVRVDRDKAALLGMTVTGVANTIRTNVAGTQSAMFREAGNEYPIVVRLRQQDRQDIGEVGDVLLSTPSGQVLPAKNIMVIDRDTGPVSIERKNQERVQRVSAETETTLSEAVAAVQARITEINVPKDFAVGFGNEVEEQNKSFNELRLVLILAIILVYTVMASQYESLRDPFIIIFSIPLAAIGVVGMLLITKTAFSMQAYIGVIMLAGIVVSNAILLVDYTNTLASSRQDGRAEGHRSGRTPPPAPDSDDLDLHRARTRAHGPRHRRRRRNAGAARPRRHRRSADLDDDHAGVRARHVYAVRGGLAGTVQEGWPPCSA